MWLSAVQPFSLLDYPGESACVAFTPGCNFRCPFCHNPSMVMPELLKKHADDRIDEGTFFNFLQERQGLLTGVSICGGEPTLHRDLPQFIKKIKDLGFNVKVDTNGRDADMIISLINKGLIDYVAIDMKHTPESYGTAAGVNINTTYREQFNRLLTTLKEGAVDYEYRTTVVKGMHTADDIALIAKYLSGIKQYYLQTYRSEQTLDDSFTGTPFSPEAMAGFSVIAQQWIEKVGIRE